MENNVKLSKRIIVLVVSILLIIGITFSFWGIQFINIFWLRLILSILINVLNGTVAFVAMKLTNIKLDIKFKGVKQYLIGIGIGIGLCLILGVIPALFNYSLVGSHQDFVLWEFFYNLFFYLVIIGPIEELIFRIYIQETFISFLPKAKWVSVIISSLLFGFFHLINGSLIQVLFTFIIGLVFGFIKYFIKNCTYLSISLGHGLYDFLNYLVTILIV